MTDHWVRESYDPEAYFCQRGDERVVMTRDEQPDHPNFDYADPIFSLNDGRLVYGGRGRNDRVHKAVSEVRDALDRFYGHQGDLDRFERYVRAFHGGTTHYYGEYYVGVGIPDHRADHGCTGDELTAATYDADWDAFIDGDVWSIRLKRRVRMYRTATSSDLLPHRGRTVTALTDGTTLVRLDDEWLEEDDTESHDYYGEVHARSSAIALFTRAKETA